MSAAAVIAWGPTVGCIYRGSVVYGLAAVLLIAGNGRSTVLSYCWLWKSNTVLLLVMEIYCILSYWWLWKSTVYRPIGGYGNLLYTVLLVVMEIYCILSYWWLWKSTVYCPIAGYGNLRYTVLLLVMEYLLYTVLLLVMEIYCINCPM